MKKFLTTLFAISSLVVAAQSQLGINYQSIIRNTGGTPITSTPVTVEFKLFSTASFTNVLLYHEIHSTTTNQFGMANLVIGKGTVVGGVFTFSNIPWPAGVAYEIYVNSNMVGSRMPFVSVPYAFAAAYAPAPSVTYSSNVLSVGGNTVSITAGSTYTDGSGININSGVITGTANIVGTGATTVNGIYPNLTISSPSVTTYSAGPGINISASGVITNTLTPITPTITGAGIANVTPTTGNNFTVSVGQPTLSYASGTNVLSLTNDGTNYTTATLSGTGSNTISIVGSGLATVTPTTGSTFSVNVPAQTLSINNGSIAISGPGGNTVALNTYSAGTGISITGLAPNYVINNTTPAAITQTLTGTGISSVTPGANTFTVNTPMPIYTPSTGVLSFGGTNTVIATPSLSILGNVVRSGPASNTITIPATNITGIGTGIATVTTAINNFTVNVQSPTYTAATGILSFGGTNTVVVTPTLSLTGTTLTSGASTNSVNLSSINNWSVTGGVISPSTLTNSVAIGTSGPTSARLEILHSATAANPHLNIASPSGLYGRMKFSNTGQANYFSTEVLNDGSGNNEAYSISQFNGTNTKQVFLINGQRMAYINALNYPLATFHVMTSAATATGGIASEGFAQAGQLNLLRNNNAGAGLRSAALGGDEIGKINFSGFDGSTFGDGAKIYAKAIENVTSSTKGTDLVFSTVPSGTSVNVDAMTIKHNGKIGIGTATPSSELDINGNVRVGNSKIFLGAIGGINSGYTGIYENGSDLRLAVFKGGATATPFAPAGNSIDALIIKMTTGRVGIGNAFPNEILHVGGNIKTDSSLIVKGLNNIPSPSAAGEGKIFFDVASQKLKASENGSAYVNLIPGPGSAAWISAAGSTTLTNSADKVGIGTSTPQSIFEVATDGSLLNGLRVSNSGSTNGPTIFLDGQSNDWTITGSNTASGAGANKLVFRDYTNSTDRMVIDATGKVGIGTTSPAAPLDVVGKTITDSLQVTTPVTPAVGAVLTSRDVAGNTKWSNPIMFKVSFAPASITTVNAAVISGIGNTSGYSSAVAFNVGNGLAVTAGNMVFTAPVAGYYNLSATMLVSISPSGSGNAYVYMELYNNTTATTIERGHSNNSDATSFLYTSLQASTVAKLNQGDQVVIRVNGSIANAGTITNNYSANLIDQFSGFLIK